MPKSPILYKSHSSLKVGELTRYQITYTPTQQATPQPSLWISIRNTEPLPLRAAVLRGPYLLYVDVRTKEYHHNVPSFITADQPKFAANLLPSQHFNAELSCHLIKDRYVWIVDVVSQVLFSAGTDVGYEIVIADSKAGLRTHGHMAEQGVFSDDLVVNVLDTIDLWNLPAPVKQKKYHLVILTHGLHSNTHADMFYIKEQIDRMAIEKGKDIIVRGFNGNVCKTEKGIRYLGSRLAEFIVNELYKENIDKVSFIGHSLGGLIQTFSIAYIQLNFPWFFQKVEPINFITMASPLLGIVNDNPTYVKAALFMGAVGRTGSELGLDSNSNDGGVPLLKLLPTGPAHHILKKFKHRTLYANSVNDGIVPLYTSALAFVDWNAINQEPNLQNSQCSSKGTADLTSVTSETSGLLHDTARTLIDPVHKAISLLAPSLQRGSSSSRNNETSEEMNNFPKASMIESAASVLLPPTPPLKYLTDPSSRDNVIIHDRVYSESDLPPPRVRRKKTFMETLDPMAKYEELEEDIARQWHKGMKWRKVLVKLEPDAHNNIIVRRRFVNGFGWAVVDHLVENHFGLDEDQEDQADSRELDNTDSDEIDKDTSDLITLMDRDTITKENQKIDSGLTTVRSISSFNPSDPNLQEDYKWINSKTHDSIFDVGPTGMLANFNELLDTFKNWGSFGGSSSTKSTHGSRSRSNKSQGLSCSQNNYSVQGGEIGDDAEETVNNTNQINESELMELEQDVSRLQDTIMQGNYY